MGGQSPRGSLARGKSRSRLAQDNRHSDSGFGKNTREKDLRSVNSLDACSEATISAWAVGRAWCEKRLRGLTMRSSPNCTSSHPSKDKMEVGLLTTGAMSRFSDGSSSDRHHHELNIACPPT
ncbi:hypothetical protein BN1708_004174 [Verticillium longisporum]|uniref:Uncharacterized protein n=1 Tax=Verticillium longisporum TaxID=100787 RepID=A0A0G4LY22_VERLO|nr:hypothetical protein BN1708_004174 [Verticillium longisporum]